MLAIFHNQELSGGVYTIHNSVNGYVYVGSTNRFSVRYKGHQTLLKKGKHNNRPLQMDFDTYGSDAFTFEVATVIADKVARISYEEEMITQFFGASCYNLVIFAPPSRQGAKHSEETRRKMRASHLGVKLSEEHRNSMSLARLGGKRSAEAKRNMSLAQTGRTQSEATKAKIAEIRRGTQQSAETKEKKRLAGLGRRHTEASKEKMRQARLGKCLSDETKAKLSAANLGKKLPEETKAKIGLASVRHAAERARLRRVFPSIEDLDKNL